MDFRHSPTRLDGTSAVHTCAPDDFRGGSSALRDPPCSPATVFGEDTLGRLVDGQMLDQAPDANPAAS